MESVLGRWASVQSLSNSSFFRATLPLHRRIKERRKSISQRGQARKCSQVRKWCRFFRPTYVSLCVSPVFELLNSTIMVFRWRLFAEFVGPASTSQTQTTPVGREISDDWRQVRCQCTMSNRLIDWLIDWLFSVPWSIDWLIDCGFIDRFASGVYTVRVRDIAGGHLAAFHKCSRSSVCV